MCRLSTVQAACKSALAAQRSVPEVASRRNLDVQDTDTSSPRWVEIRPDKRALRNPRVRNSNIYRKHLVSMLGNACAADKPSVNGTAARGT